MCVFCACAGCGCGNGHPPCVGEGRQIENDERGMMNDEDNAVKLGVKNYENCGRSDARKYEAMAMLKK
jgi:hypothetical protein